MDTSFSDGITQTAADWFNDLNRLHYTIFGDPANLAAAQAALLASPIAIGSGTPAAGTFTTLTGTTIHTDAQSTSCDSGVATTLFNTSTSAGLYLVFAFASAAGSANYTAFATVLNEGSDARIVTGSNGSLLTLTLSGTSVQATQTSGITSSVTWAYIRVR